MTAAAGVKLTGAWASFLKALNGPAFEARLRGSLLVANERIGRQAVARIQRSIRAGEYAENSPVTVILKGSSKPLVHKGDLYQQVSYEAQPFSLRIGIFKRSAGQDAVNLGLVLHEGATIDVAAHPAVRRKVFALMNDALGKKRAGKSRKATVAASAAFGAGGGPAKSVWTIPARPFIANPIGASSFRAFALQQWGNAVRVALLGGKGAA